MKRKIIIATKNRGKLIEFSKILSNREFEISSLLDLENVPEIDEDGSTFEENAIKKSEHIFKINGQPAIADDSGLEIDYLNGAPGIKSSRFEGDMITQDVKNEKIIEVMKGVNENKRGAQFRCVIAFTDNKGTRTFEGVCRGKISDRPKGSNGFGYDPIFIPEGYYETFGELKENVKNNISHRASALKKFHNWFMENKDKVFCSNNDKGKVLLIF